jgi:DNA-binding NarL/FixJ family response regulator
MAAVCRQTQRSPARTRRIQPPIEPLNRDLLSVLAHELRTPLNSIVGWVNVLQSGRANAALTATALWSIASSAQTQGRLIEDIVDAMRTERNQLQLRMEALDVRIPIESAIDVVKPAARSSVTRALQAGVTGYMLKDSASSDLLKGIEAVAAGRAFFSPAITRLMLDDYVRRAATGLTDRYDTLSAREREIFRLIAEARTSKEVAELLDISAATVESHRARILQKLDIHNTAELVLYAARRGVIS